MIFVAATFSGFSQEKGTTDFGVSVGAASSNDILDLGSKVVGTVASLGTVSYSNLDYSPNISVWVKRATAKNLFVYLDGSFMRSTSDVAIGGSKDGVATNRYYTLGLGTEYHYIHCSWFQMYTGASVAYTYLDYGYAGSQGKLNRAHNSYFNGQFNALGFRFGGALALNAELGFGYKGVANVGLSYQF